MNEKKLRKIVTETRLKRQGRSKEWINRFWNIKTIKKIEAQQNMMQGAKRGTMTAGEYNLRLKNIKRRRNK
ncbi:MAG: hypothetical protein U9O94_05215 [Nanoarchaeota archaeon]|nr:hypothetical protein [Nanoarchaeota archaeon]